MKWKEYKADEAKEAFDSFCNSGEYEVISEYNDLRNDLVSLFNNALSELGISRNEISSGNNSYQIDLRFGLKMYVTMNEKYGMNTRFAATDGIWRYISTSVVPDLVAMRYGKDHPDRFWKKPKRLWLRVLWWYIYLSWQGTEEQTFSILKDNSTDEILQLVDRCGHDGYRVGLCREMMKKNASINLAERRKEQLFRKMMVLNTARVQVIEPELMPGGNVEYVDSLCKYFLR